MARPRKNPHAPPSVGPVDGCESPPGSVEGVLDKHGLPPRDIDSRPNPAYYRAAYAAVFDLTFNSVKAGGALPFNADSVMKMIDREAEAAGFDPKTIKDQRPPEQVFAESCLALLSAEDSVWERIDDELKAIEEQMDRADRGAFTYLRDKIDKLSATGPKAWRNRLEKIRRLRTRAKNPVTPEQIKRLQPISIRPDNESVMTAAIEAAWPLRVMIYCGRTNIADRLNESRAKAVYDISTHHVKASCDYWEARNRVAFRKMPNDSFPHIVRGVRHFKGCILVIPFGHGKTDMGRFFCATEFVKNPKTQAALNHANAEKAQETLAYLASLFSQDSPIGRRFFSLFGLQTEQSNAKGFRLFMPDRLKSPSAWAAGVKSKVLGGNTSYQWWDDPVPMSDAEQESERKRTFAQLNGQWTSRQRGQNWFTLVTATLWHNDDAIAALIKLAKDGKILFRCSIQSCGGPKSSPPFKSLWPTVMPSSELKARYQQMRSPSLYSAAYMSDPRSDSNRIVRKLRLYDPMLEEHQAFMANSVKYMSLDPSATVGRQSDLAGVLYAGFGDVQVVRTEDGKPVYSTEKRIRVITCESIPATQSDLVKHAASVTVSRTVDYVLVEARSGFIGTCEMFENQFGITPIRFDPKNKNKEERLRAAAPAMENANNDVGLYAVVEFPGQRTGRILNDGTNELVIHPSVANLALEIMDFGVCGTDHEIDTLSQLVIYLSPELGIGTGGVVNKAKVLHERKHENAVIDRMLDTYMKMNDKPKTEMDSEQAWIRNNWSMPHQQSTEWNG